MITAAPLRRFCKCSARRLVLCAVVTVASITITVLLHSSLNLFVESESKRTDRSQELNYRLEQQSKRRVGSNLVYWTPHKTGSTSMRYWLRKISAELQLGYVGGPYYPNTPFTEWHSFARRSVSNGDDCSILVGHIRISSVADRRDERSLGAVITTVRSPLDVLASKYFHRTKQELGDDLEDWKKKRSRSSRLWFFHWNDYDPCEQLRYYDGLEGCEMSTLKRRAQAIADRIDCVVDMDDPNEDLQALCTAMGVANCEKFPEKNKRFSASIYHDLYEIEHIRDAIRRVEVVTATLRDALMTKRCGVLLKVDASIKKESGWDAPAWPFLGCNNRTK